MSTAPQAGSHAARQLRCCIDGRSPAAGARPRRSPTSALPWLTRPALCPPPKCRVSAIDRHDALAESYTCLARAEGFSQGGHFTSLGARFAKVGGGASSSGRLWREATAGITALWVFLGGWGHCLLRLLLPACKPCFSKAGAAARHACMALPCRLLFMPAVPPLLALAPRPPSGLRQELLLNLAKACATGPRQRNRPLILPWTLELP